MRVGINASFLRKPATGIGQVTLHFLEELARMSHAKHSSSKDEYFVYTEEPCELPEALKTAFVIQSALPSLWKRDDLLRTILWEKSVLPKMAQKDHCDVLISLYQSSTITPKHMQHIMIVHDIIPKVFPEYLNNTRKKIYQKSIEKAIQKADHIVAVSRYTAHDILEILKIDSKKISIAYPDTDPLFRKQVHPRESERVLDMYSLLPGYMYSGGGLEKRKNTETVIRAYALLIEDYTKRDVLSTLPKLVISGKLMPELSPLIVDVEKVVKSLGIEKHVHILGFVPQEHLPSLYAQASVFLFPSLYEGFGLPVLEAMHQGVPVITSKRTSIPEIGRDAVAYCDPEDTHDTMRVMKEVLEDAQLRARLSVAGKRRAQDFSWKVFVREVMHCTRLVKGIGVKD